MSWPGFKASSPAIRSASPSPTARTTTTRRRSATSVPNLTCNRHLHAGVWTRQCHRWQPLQPGARESRVAGELFRCPAPFTPGNAGRNIVTGPGIMYSQVSAKKNFPHHGASESAVPLRFPESVSQLRIQQSKQPVRLKNPQLFGKITGDQTTASFNGQPLMNLMLRLSF